MATVPAVPDYAELRCVSNFTFLRGASQPEELVARAKQLGYTALAIADECSMAGIVRAHVAAKEQGLKLLAFPVGEMKLLSGGKGVIVLAAGEGETMLSAITVREGGTVKILGRTARTRQGSPARRHRGPSHRVDVPLAAGARAEATQAESCRRYPAADLRAA